MLPILRQSVAERLSIAPYHVAQIEAHEQFRDELKHSLFLGLADGARVDELRRSAGLDTNQVEASYYLAASRIIAMSKKMGVAFRNIFLIDDFYGSGKSVLRWEKDDHWLETYVEGAEPKGHLQRFLDILQDAITSSSIESAPKVHVCLYVTTEQAISHIRRAVSDHSGWSQIGLPSVSAALIIHDDSRLICGTSDANFDKILHDMYQPEVLMNEHRSVGGDKVVHGFSDCGLPLVFGHNTPNNSVYLLWETLGGYVGLFPRVDRYKVVD